MNLDFFRNRKKFLLIIIFLIYSTISGQIVVPKDFMKIPDSLFYKEQLYKNIIPNKQYNYWKVVRKTSSEDQIVFESKKNYSSQPEINNNISDGFFVECLPDGCFSYLEVYCNNTPRYINTEVGLKEFMGYIDNLSEALLIAKTYGFWFDRKDELGGSYKIESDFIHLYLAKFKTCPVSSEAYYIKINRKTGELEQENKGIYYKKDDCYTS
ncbi:hypothetical protein [Epilithonimonas hominis]|nr:hypothetical protein [Epilithonimonas hominis]